MPTRTAASSRPRTRVQVKLYFGSIKSVLEFHDGLYTRYAGSVHPRQRTGEPIATRGHLQGPRGLALRAAGHSRYPATAVEACLGGQFLVETRAGRDAIAAGVIDHIAAIGVRNGLDGILLTCLYHLKATHSAQLDHGMDVWRGTRNTVNTGLVVFNSEVGEVARLKKPAFDPANDPFAGGVQGPAWQQTLAARHGGNVMDISCQTWFTAGGMILGGAIGGAVGGVKGAIAGASAGADIGGAVGGVACGWAESDKPDPDPGGTKGGGFKDDEGIIGDPGSGKKDGGFKDDEDHNGVINNNTSSSNDTSSSNGTTQDTTSNGDEKGFPPPSDAFPAPDDDGSGNPWSVIGTVELSAHEISVLAGSQVGGIYSTKALQPITTGEHSLEPSQTLFGNLTLKTDQVALAAQRTQLLQLAEDLSLHAATPGIAVHSASSHR